MAKRADARDEGDRDDGGEAPPSALEGRVAALIDPAIAAMGFELVRVMLTGRGRRHQTLQIMAEPLPEPRDAPKSTPRRFMTVDDCATLSRSIGALLEAADTVPGAYSLEVSSPGLDRPLCGAAQFARFTGYEARVELALARDGRKRFAGVILAVTEDAVRLQCEDGEVELPFAGIAKAKLVLTDALMSAASGGRL